MHPRPADLRFGMGRGDEEADIKITRSEDGRIYWLQLKMTDPIDVDTFLFELEIYLNEVNNARAEKLALIDPDH